MPLYRALYIGSDNKAHCFTVGATDPQKGLALAEKLAPAAVLTFKAVPAWPPAASSQLPLELACNAM